MSPSILVPTWMPDGYEQMGEVSFQGYPDFGKTEFFVSYSDGENICTINVIRNNEIVQGSLYEKIPDNPESVMINDIEHYFVQNTGSIMVAWFVGNLECTINTTMSESDLIRVLNSIYEGATVQ